MFCPLCRAEFGREHTHCTQCGIELLSIEDVPTPLEFHESSQPLCIAWQGSDPSAVSYALSELRGAGLPHSVIATHDHLVFELSIPRPRYQILVLESDLEKAQEYVGSITEGSPFAFSTPEHQALEQEPLAPYIVGVDGRTLAWSPRQATVEIWSGQDTALLRILKDCLAENGIRCRMENGRHAPEKLFVHPKDESRAREIIRQVLEGVPPEC